MGVAVIASNTILASSIGWNHGYCSGGHTLIFDRAKT